MDIKPSDYNGGQLEGNACRSVVAAAAQFLKRIEARSHTTANFDKLKALNYYKVLNPFKTLVKLVGSIPAW